MGDAEPVDQKKYLEDSCKPKCVRPLIEYQVNCEIGPCKIGRAKWLRDQARINVYHRDQIRNCFKACVKRVEGDQSGEKHCTGQYFDYWHCIDRAVSPKLFDKLK